MLPKCKAFYSAGLNKVFFFFTPYVNFLNSPLYLQARWRRLRRQDLQASHGGGRMRPGGQRPGSPGQGGHGHAVEHGDDGKEGAVQIRVYGEKRLKEIF